MKKTSIIIKVAILLVTTALLCGPVMGATPISPPDGATRVAKDTPVRRARNSATPQRQRGSRAQHGNRHNGRHRGGDYGRGHYGRGHYGYGGYGYYGYGYGYRGLFGWPYYYGYYGPRHYGYNMESGSVDLNIKPKKTKVYVNGEFLGKVGRFDGFPQNLILPAGNHELIFYLKGHKTVKKRVEVVAGTVLRANFEMEAGEPTPVAQLTTAVKDREAERQRLYEQYAKDRTNAGQSKLREERAPQSVGAPREQNSSNHSAVLDLSISPADAVVYLDGRFLGKADSLTANNGRVVVTDGPHTMEIVRPGYTTKKLSFEGTVGGVIRIDAALEATDQ